MATFRSCPVTVFITDLMQTVMGLGVELECGENV